MICTDDTRVKLSSSSVHATLKMKDVQRSDSGIYDLNLSNAVGSNTYQMEVLVLGKILCRLIGNNIPGVS